MLRGRLQRWGEPRALVLAAAVFLALAAPLVHYYLMRPIPEQRLVDLEVYREAAHSVLSGRPVYWWVTPPPQLLPFTYPAVAAVFFLPLALAPFGLWQWLWTAMQLALLVMIVAVAYRPFLVTVRADPRLGPWTPAVVAALAGLMLWLLPVRDGIKFGQVDLILVGLVLADYVARRPRWPRGALVGLATAVKLTPGVFIVHLWLAGKRREAITAVATAVAVTLLGFLAIPEESFDYWARAFFESDRLGANDGTSNQAIRGVLLRLLPDGPLNTVAWLVLVAVVAVVGFRYAVRASRMGHDLGAYAIVAMLAVLLSPVSWIHHLAWLVVALAVLLGDGSDLDTRRTTAAAGVWVYFACTIPWWGVAMLGGDEMPRWAGRLVQQGFFAGALVMLPLLFWAVRRDAAAGAPPAPAAATPSRPLASLPR